jgi:hypothetical protein
VVTVIRFNHCRREVCAFIALLFALLGIGWGGIYPKVMTGKGMLPFKIGKTMKPGAKLMHSFSQKPRMCASSRFAGRGRFFRVALEDTYP